MSLDQTAPDQHICGWGEMSGVCQPSPPSARGSCLPPTGTSGRGDNPYNRPSGHPVSWAARAVVTDHQRPSTRVRHPGRESNPVLSCSQ
jgi:hypothetical protein